MRDCLNQIETFGGTQMPLRDSEKPVDSSVLTPRG